MTATHADDALLIQQLHDALETTERAELDEHLAHCAACRARRDILAAQEAHIGRVLAVTDVAPPDDDQWRAMRTRIAARAQRETVRRRHRQQLRRAAMIALLVAPAAAAASPTVRAWLVDQFPLRTSDESTTVTRIPDTAATVSFGMNAQRLSVILATRQLDGTLAVHFAAGARARLTVSGGGTEQLAVGVGMVRIANDADARASYTLELPAHADEVAIRIGDRPELVLRRAQGSLAEVDLETGVVRNPAARDN